MQKLTNKKLLSVLEANFDASIKRVYEYEGGYQNSPNDTGNYFNGKLIGTNLGITPQAYYNYYHSAPGVDTIKNLTRSKSDPIYQANYWNKIRGNEIANDAVASLMLDSVVQSGLSQIKAFKKIANAISWKKIFAETTTPFTAQEIKLLNALPQQTYFNQLKAYRKRFYEDLAKKQPKNKVFINGWLKRLDKHKFSGVGSGFSFDKRTTLIALGVISVAAGGYYVYQKQKKSRTMPAF